MNQLYYFVNQLYHCANQLYHCVNQLCYWINQLYYCSIQLYYWVRHHQLVQWHFRITCCLLGVPDQAMKKIRSDAKLLAFLLFWNTRDSDSWINLIFWDTSHELVCFSLETPVPPAVSETCSPPPMISPCRSMGLKIHPCQRAVWLRWGKQLPNV